MSKIIIIGNGFDIALGWKTSYTDFIQSEEFISIINHNLLVKHLSEIQQEQNWVDIEHELVKYAKLKPKPALLKQDFTELKLGLCEYLRSATSDDLIKTIEGNHPKRIATDYFIINDSSATYSLNFTHSASVIQRTQLKGGSDTYEVHGNCQLDNIVFGVADATVSEEYNFLLKSDHAAYGEVNLAKAIQDCKEAHFYGLSFGDTDDNHFKPAFLNLKHKTLIFYVYGLQGYESVRNRLVILSRNGLAGLKTNNNVRFFDVSNDRCTEITQYWLNEKYTAHIS